MNLLKIKRIGFSLLDSKIRESRNDQNPCFNSMYNRSLISNSTFIFITRFVGKFFFAVVLFLNAFNVYAQINDYEVAQKFKALYNQQLTDSIFSLFSPLLKEKLPLEKTAAVFSGLHVQLGDMRSLIFIKQDSGFTRYKAGFSHQTFTMLLALNKDGLMDGIRFVPYIPEDPVEEKKR
jgi:hypothetical protein